MNLFDALGLTALFILCVLVGFMTYQPRPRLLYKDLNA